MEKTGKLIKVTYIGEEKMAEECRDENVKVPFYIIDGEIVDQSELDL